MVNAGFSGKRSYLLVICLSVILISCSNNESETVSSGASIEDRVRLAQEELPACNVTQPNQWKLPIERVTSGTRPGAPMEQSALGNGRLWVLLPTDGVVVFEPGSSGEINEDGSMAMKFPWWRAVPGAPLVIEGHRLDGVAPPLRSHVPSGYDWLFQATALIFPTEGCWEVTGTVAGAKLTFVVQVVRLE